MMDLSYTETEGGAAGFTFQGTVFFSCDVWSYQPFISAAILI